MSVVSVKTDTCENKSNYYDEGFLMLNPLWWGFAWLLFILFLLLKEKIILAVATNVSDSKDGHLCLYLFVSISFLFFSLMFCFVFFCFAVTFFYIYKHMCLIVCVQMSIRVWCICDWTKSIGLHYLTVCRGEYGVYERDRQTDRQREVSVFSSELETNVHIIETDFILNSNVSYNILKVFTVGECNIFHISADIDECSANICSHTCVNTEGGFLCSCPPGMMLANDGTTCVGQWFHSI